MLDLLPHSDSSHTGTFFPVQAVDTLHQSSTSRQSVLAWAGVSPSVQPALVTPTAKLNASLQLVRALSNVSAQKLSAGAQPATYVLSAAQPTTDTVQLPIASTAKHPVTRPGTTPPVFARLLGPGSGIRLAGILPNDVAAVQQQFASSTRPLAPGSVTMTTASTVSPAPSTSASQ